MSEPQNQDFNFTRSISLHKTSFINVHFWKWVVSNHGRLTEVKPGYDMVLPILAVWSACLSLILWKFFVDTSRFVVGTLHALARACNALRFTPSWNLLYH